MSLPTDLRASEDAPVSVSIPLLSAGVIDEHSSMRLLGIKTQVLTRARQVLLTELAPWPSRLWTKLLYH